MNTTNTKEHYILLYSPNILSLIAIPSIDTCHSPSAPWHISSRTRPVLRKARCNSQGHGKSIHTRGPTPDSQTTFFACHTVHLCKKPLGICHCMRRCSQSRHKATYKDTSAPQNHQTIILYQQGASHHSSKQAFCLSDAFMPPTSTDFM